MTKRFTIVNMGLDGRYIKEDGKIMEIDRVVDLLNENEYLKEALKNSYLNEICENCKYGNYFKTDNFIGGFEWDFECTKKHFGKEHWKCDGLTECDDFELKIER